MLGANLHVPFHPRQVRDLHLLHGGAAVHADEDCVQGNRGCSLLFSSLRVAKSGMKQSTRAFRKVSHGRPKTRQVSRRGKAGRRIGLVFLGFPSKQNYARRRL